MRVIKVKMSNALDNRAQVTCYQHEAGRTGNIGSLRTA